MPVAPPEDQCNLACQSAGHRALHPSSIETVGHSRTAPGAAESGKRGGALSSPAIQERVASESESALTRRSAWSRAKQSGGRILTMLP